MDNRATFTDYYEVLGVWPTADADAIKQAYFKLAKLHHPDVVGEEAPKGDIDFKLINEAFSILSNDAKRHEFDETLKKRNGGNTQRKEADRRSSQLAYEQARTAMKSNRYDKAVVLLKSAIKYDDSNPAYHSWYGFSLGILKAHLHEARDACKKALEMEFYNADFHANLGFVYYQAGLTSTADESFEEALKWDPDHSVALKYYGGGTGARTEKTGLAKLFSFFGGSGSKEPAPKKAPARRPKAKKR